MWFLHWKGENFKLLSNSFIWLEPSKPMSRGTICTILNTRRAHPQNIHGTWHCNPVSAVLFRHLLHIADVNISLSVCEPSLLRASSVKRLCRNKTTTHRKKEIKKEKPVNIKCRTQLAHYKVGWEERHPSIAENRSSRCRKRRLGSKSRFASIEVTQVWHTTDRNHWSGRYFRGPQRRVSQEHAIHPFIRPPVFITAKSFIYSCWGDETMTFVSGQPSHVRRREWEWCCTTDGWKTGFPEEGPWKGGPPWQCGQWDEQGAMIGRKGDTGWTEGPSSANRVIRWWEWTERSFLDETHRLHHSLDPTDIVWPWGISLNNQYL